VWGAEFLVADLAGYRRAGQLRYARLPGGDLAAREPWRAALGYAALEPDAGIGGRAFADVPPERQAIARRQIERQLNAPLVSSIGRLFDAAAAVLGVCPANQYEGQAAMQLEALAGRRRADALPFPLTRAPEGMWMLDPVPLLAALSEQLERGIAVDVLAARFHESVATTASELAARLAADAGVGTVALGGGCFQNVRLLVSLKGHLEARGIRVLIPRQLSPNDGAVSYGQAAVAASLLQGEA
jgi:hydrogenase maturation protein HypF